MAQDADRNDGAEATDEARREALGEQVLHDGLMYGRRVDTEAITIGDNTYHRFVEYVPGTSGKLEDFTARISYEIIHHGWFGDTTERTTNYYHPGGLVLDITVTSEIKDGVETVTGVQSYVPETITLQVGASFPVKTPMTTAAGTAPSTLDPSSGQDSRYGTTAHSYDQPNLEPHDLTNEVGHPTMGKGEDWDFGSGGHSDGRCNLFEQIFNWAKTCPNDLLGSADETDTYTPGNDGTLPGDSGLAPGSGGSLSGSGGSPTGGGDLSPGSGSPSPGDPSPPGNPDDDPPPPPPDATALAMPNPEGSGPGSPNSTPNPDGDGGDGEGSHHGPTVTQGTSVGHLSHQLAAVGNSQDSAGASDGFHGPHNPGEEMPNPDDTGGGNPISNIAHSLHVAIQGASTGLHVSALIAAATATAAHLQTGSNGIAIMHDFIDSQSHAASHSFIGAHDVFAHDVVAHTDIGTATHHDALTQHGGSFATQLLV